MSKYACNGVLMDILNANYCYIYKTNGIAR